ncbi:MAG: hypothetical protein JSS49_27600 [Planctomycetes bacterium]|nr:hypothetical protein [Planctomycetota bacterium]
MVIVSALATGEAAAQRMRHHHHDAAGHMIDHAGHHIDAYGRHTGAVGVYHNQYGQSLYQQPVPQVYVNPVGPGYGNTGGYFSASVPQNVVPYSLQSNVAVGTPNSNGGAIKIFNPADSGGEVKYTLNGTAYSIQPGYSQVIQFDRVWTVEFGSGGSAGNIRYSLQPGLYKFKVTDTGWNLFQSQDLSTAIPVAPIPMPPPADAPRPGLVP